MLSLYFITKALITPRRMSRLISTVRIPRSLVSLSQPRISKAAEVFRVSRNPMASSGTSTERHVSNITTVFSKDSVPRE